MAKPTALAAGSKIFHFVSLENEKYFALGSVLFYFAIIRPQRLRTKELENRVKGLRPGDKILTSGGILGTIVSIKEKSLSIRSEDTKLEVLKTSVSEVTERKGEPVEAKS